MDNDVELFKKCTVKLKKKICQDMTPSFHLFNLCWERLLMRACNVSSKPARTS